MKALKLFLIYTAFLLIARGIGAAEPAGNRAAFIAADGGKATAGALETLKTLHPESLILTFAEGASPDLPADTGAVIVLRQGKGSQVRIINGRRGSTSPRWLLLAATEALEESGERYSLAIPQMPIYRLGWTADDPDLAKFAPVGIPSILVEIPAEGTRFLPYAAERLSTGISASEDRHYLTFRIRNRLFVPGEETLVTAMIGVFAIVFFNLFFLSFAYGKRSEQHLRDFFRVWWLPFFYYGATLVSLFAGQAFVSWLMGLTFGDPQGWTVIPERALAGKLIFAFFFTSLLVTLNQLIPFPKGSFIYGYIASIVCLVNIFVFSSLDFSLSVLFSLVFALSYALTHVRNTGIQIAGLLLLLLPFIPYIRELTRADAQTLTPLYEAGFAWNSRLALFIVPYQLFMTRLTHSVGVLRPKKGIHVPVLPMVALIPAILFTAFLVLAPAWTEERPLPVLIRQTLEGRNLETTTRSDVGKAVFTVTANRGEGSRPDLPRLAAAVLPGDIRVRKALERSIVSVNIVPMIPLDGYTLVVSSDNSGSVLASSRDFQRSPSGDSATFQGHTRTEEPFSIEFTALSGLRLELDLTARIYANPWGITISDPAVSSTYELVVRRVFVLDSDGKITETGAE